MNSLFSLFSRLELSPVKGFWLQAILAIVAITVLLLNAVSNLAICLAVLVVVVLILSIRGQRNQEVLVQNMKQVLLVPMVLA